MFPTVEPAGIPGVEIASVHAGSENRTAIHLRLFSGESQLVFLGFHRFIAVFSRFVRFLAHIDREMAV